MAQRIKLLLDRQAALELMKVLGINPRPPESLQFAAVLNADGSLTIDLLIRGERDGG